MGPGAGGGIFMSIIPGLIVAVLIIIPFWKIFPRAGLPAALSILMVIPVVNLIMLYVLAFKQWPTD